MLATAIVYGHASEHALYKSQVQVQRSPLLHCVGCKDGQFGGTKVEPSFPHALPSTTWIYWMLSLRY